MLQEARGLSNCYCWSDTEKGWKTGRKSFFLPSHIFFGRTEQESAIKGVMEMKFAVLAPLLQSTQHERVDLELL